MSFPFNCSFDRIYADTALFCGIEPVVTAKKATTWEQVVRVRHGVANTTGSTEDRVPWLQL
jgi:hypothetical protein